MLGRKRTWRGKAAIVAAIIFTLFISIYYLRLGPPNKSTYIGERRVAVKKEQGRYLLYKEGKPFEIRGGAGYKFTDELLRCGGNTLICWDTAKLAAVLEDASQHQLMVIIGIDVPGVQYFDGYHNTPKVDSLFAATTALISRYKDHPALLAWCLGNELKFPNSISYDPFYVAYNKLLAMIHANDPHHPVCTTVINVSKNNIVNIRWRVPAIDFIGLNIYNSIRTLDTDLSFLKVFWNGPYFVSEWAPRGGWESNTTSWKAPIEKNSTDKAQDYYDFYTRHMPLQDPRFLGSLVFYWGSRQEYTPTFYSIFSENGTPTEIMETMKDCWSGNKTQHVSPQLVDMNIDQQLHPQDNIMLNAGSAHSAAIQVKTTAADSLSYHWELLKEDWSSWGKVWVHFKKPMPEPQAFINDSLSAVTFRVPAKEGPYRLFVTVSNARGFCANANIPFYVIQ
ncbi:MAG TPA: hypothetical protein VL307_08195 [Chitinophagaceae bacterium]|nr:hypothetical protein [Chitinophagaceae bacterium]